MRRRGMLVTTIGLAAAIALAVAPAAQAFQYLISPYLEKDTTYGFGECRVGGHGTGTKNLTVYVASKSCVWDMIGGRAVDSAGNTTSITWDYNRDEVVPLYRANGVDKYKVYKTVGDI